MPAKIVRRAPAPAAAVAARPSSAAAAPLRGKAVARRVLVQFTRQFAVLLEAGVPVLRSLQILEGRLESGPFKRVLAAVAEDVAGGTPLSEALGKHPKVFDRLFANMIRAGEAGGVLDPILGRLADYLERMQAVRDRVGGALLYPCIVVVIAGLVLGVVFVVVIPRFEEIYGQLEADLPGLTESLIGTSRFAAKWWWAILAGIAGVLLGLRLAYSRASGFRRFLHARALRLPFLGTLVARAVIARFSRTLGTLLSSGVPHLEALSIVQATTGNLVVAEAIGRVRDRVKEGEGLAAPMEATGVFDSLVVNMVEVGEQTGELDRMCLRVADAYDLEVDRRLEALFKAVEPILLVAMAVVVGVIVLALFLPLLGILERLGA